MPASNASLGTAGACYIFVYQCSQGLLDPDFSDLLGTLERVHLIQSFPGENSQISYVS